MTTQIRLNNTRCQTDIALFAWPLAKPRAVVHVNHGLAEHAKRYERFAQALNQTGVSVFAHDHRGHGATTAPDAPPTIFCQSGDGVEPVMSDVSAVHDYIRSQHANAPLIMFGHSMGGLITMNYALRNGERLAGAAVWNSNFSAGIAGRLAQGLLAVEQFRLGSDVPSRLLPKLTFADWAKKVPEAKTPFDWLSHKPDEVQRYIDDPLCGWDASVSMWRDVFSMIFAGAAVHKASVDAKRVPFHLLGGGQDPATNNGKAVSAQAAAMTKAGFSRVDSVIYPDARHETLNEHDEGKATKAFVAWIDALL